jgi:glutamate formiminotransferase/formiminotetrahydrofolate cyclodeaminase
LKRAREGIRQFRKARLEDFVTRVARISPLLPAGGSVAALAGALAAALGEMVAGLTEGRKKFAAEEAQVRRIHANLSLLRDKLLGLVQEDADVFKRVLKALELPRKTEAQRTARAKAYDLALLSATEAPLEIARASAEILELLSRLMKIGNPNAKCDAAAGVQTAFASLKAAQYSVLANIRGLGNKGFARDCRSEVLDLARRGRTIQRQVDSELVGL